MSLPQGGNYNDMIGITPPPEAPETPLEQKVGWVHNHPHLAIGIAASVFVFFCIFMVLQRMGVAPESGSGAWGGAGGLSYGIQKYVTARPPTAEELTKAQSPNESVAFIPIIPPSVDGVVESTAGYDDAMKDLLALITNPDPVAKVGSEPETGFSLIPQGFISTDAPQKKRTPEQTALHNYGNAVGTYVKSFESMHANMSQILKDHFESRTDAEQKKNVRNLGIDLAQLGGDLQTIRAPESIVGTHKEYAFAYRVLGTNLVKISESTTDEALLEAINTYNASVEEMTKKFVLLVALFGANDVTFTPNEDGSMFVFTAAPAL